MSEIFNNREIATAVWLTGFAGWALAHKDIRSASRDLLAAFAHKAILLPFGILAANTIGAVYVLQQMGIWDASQTKNTILWFLTAASISLFRINEASEDEHYFRKAIADNLKIIVALEFFITFYSFSLTVELILVPLMTFLVALLAFSERKEEHTQTAQLLNQLIELIGGILILYAVSQFILDKNDFLSTQTLRDFFIPIVLSLLLIPYLYFLYIFLEYEKIFLRLGFAISEKKLLTYAKRTALSKYHLNVQNMRRWADSLNRKSVKNRKDIDEAHKELKRSLKEAKNPPVVKLKDGWSPYSAREFINSSELRTGHYSNIYDDVWHASSPYFEFGPGVLANNIAYYIEGNAKSVTSLKLNMNINQQAGAREAHLLLSEAAEVLHLNALGTRLAKEIEKAILQSKKITRIKQSKKITVSVDNFLSGNGYHVTFKISN